MLFNSLTTAFGRDPETDTKKLIDEAFSFLIAFFISVLTVHLGAATDWVKGGGKIMTAD